MKMILMPWLQLITILNITKKNLWKPEASTLTLNLEEKLL